MTPRVGATCLALLLAACGDDGAAPLDAAVADAGADAGVAIAPAALPSLAPCPVGWREVPAEPPTCDPWPEAGASECGPGEAHFPGEPGCAPAGAACPDGEWPEDLPTDATVLHVRSTAAAGGDGTLAAPFATITEAAGVASAGATIAVAAGTYTEGVFLPAGVTLRGACAARTVITEEASVVGLAAMVTVQGEGVTVADVTLTGDRFGLMMGPGTSVHLEGVVVEGTRATGLRVTAGSDVTGRGVIVRDTRSRADGILGMGVLVEEGSSLSLERAVLSGNRSSGLVTLGGPVTLRDAAIRSTQEQADGQLGSALGILGGAEVLLERAALEDSRDLAVVVAEASTLTLRDTVVRDTRSRALDGRKGRGLYVIEASRAVLERVLLERNREVAILVADLDSAATLTDVVVRETEGQEADGFGGSAVSAQGGASVRLERALLSMNRGAASIVFRDSTMELLDVTIRDTRSLATDGRQGDGLHAQGGARVTGARVALARNRGVGIVALEPGTSIVLEDVSVLDTLERECAVDSCAGLGFGDGVLSTGEATIGLTRFRVERSARSGLHLGGGYIDATHGLVVDNPIGAAVQTPGFDVARISEGVLYLDNVRNLDTSALPLPEPSTGFGR